MPFYALHGPMSRPIQCLSQVRSCPTTLAFLRQKDCARSSLHEGMDVATGSNCCPAIYPLEEISATALGEAMACWDVDPSFAWAALDLGLRLSVGRWTERISPYGFDHTSNRTLIEAALTTSLGKCAPPRHDTDRIARSMGERRKCQAPMGAATSEGFGLVCA